MATLTKAQHGIIRHSLGLDRSNEAYRNYFCAGPGHSDLGTIRECIALGLMRASRTINEGRDTIYAVTDAGRRAIQAPPAQENE